MTRDIRLWPGVVAVSLQWLLWFVTPRLVVGGMLWQMGGSALSGLAVLLWWMFFSRVPHLERWGALGLIGGLGVAFRAVVDPSIRGGMMGAMFPLYSFPVVTTALVVAAAADAAVGFGDITSCGAGGFDRGCFRGVYRAAHGRHYG
jgi:hypothetical protein